MSTNRSQKPFSIRCSFCGTIAESWHAKFRHQAPSGATIGMASCKCGKTLVDASEVPDMGRLMVCKPKDGLQ